MATLEAGFLAMLQNPPDPNEPRPLSNRHATMYGATLPFHVLAWVAVIFRLYVRLRVVRDPGWDDALIAVCSVFNLSAMVGFIGTICFGLGHHLTAIPTSRAVVLMKFLYLNFGSYYMCAGVVKLSLLLQYLRLFKSGLIRTLCIVLAVLTGIWTIFWTVQGWVPCVPVAGFWDRFGKQHAKCWGTGWANVDGFMTATYAFSVSNMVLDTIIFAIPMSFYLKPGVTRRQLLALGALFTLGSVVVLMSILRVWATVSKDKNNPSINDFTWWYPTPLTIACIEIDFAIICASIPIFWPVVVASLPQIFVTREVHVTTHQRIDDFEMDRPTSFKSNNSQEGLTHAVEEAKSTNYRDPFVIDHVTGKHNAEVVVKTDLDQKWFR